MPTSTAPALLARLVDDAGLFPPERLPMDAALTRHRADAAAHHPVLTHRFLCPASRLQELAEHFQPDDDLALGLIADTGPARLGEAVAAATDLAPLARLEQVESPVPDDVDVRDGARFAGDAVPAAIPLYVELPRRPGWLDALPQLADTGRGAKVRCGGTDDAMFPTPDELAEFLVAAAAAGVAVKATAGLHHAVRHRDARTGFTHHGFLNLLVAAVRAVDGGSADDVRAVLAETDGAALAEAAREVDDATAARARGLLVGYGSCSTSEPLDDLAALGLA